MFCLFILDIRNNSLLIIERLNLHYYAIIIKLVENGLKTAILWLIAIISETSYCPAIFFIVTGLHVHVRSLHQALISLPPVLT